MNWSPDKYLEFQDERTRPARNLLDAVPDTAPRRVMDLGCGPGNSTELLVARFGDAAIEGLDTSAEMLDQARERLPNVEFTLGSIADWKPAEDYDVVFANASMQWLPDHHGLFPQLVSRLNPGGTLAVQMPDNLGEPSHTSVDEIAARPEWSLKLEAGGAARKSVLKPAEYYSLLSPLCSRVDIWRTTYFHVLGGPEDIVSWFEGSRLRPYLALLDDAEKARFLALYLEAITQHYPRQSDGRVLLAFPRLFIVCTR